MKTATPKDLQRIGLSLMGVAILRLLWETWGGEVLCVCFSVAILIYDLQRIRLYGGYECLGLMGSLMNSVATIANGGTMPVIGGSRDVIWVPLQESHRVKFLCDIYWGWSLGDFVLTLWLVVFMVRLARSHMKKLVPIPIPVPMPQVGWTRGGVHLGAGESIEFRCAPYKLEQPEAKP